MTTRFQFTWCAILMLALAGCTTQPAAIPPTPPPTLEPKRIIVTQVVFQPTPTARIVTMTPLPSPTSAPATPSSSLSHEWVDYGGICMRPDNFPAGVAIHPNPEVVKATRRQLLDALWYLVNASAGAERVSPWFSSPSRFGLGTLNGAKVRGLVVPVGETADKSLFRLADPVTLWEGVYPDQNIQGIALDIVCIEFFDPLDFITQQKTHPGVQTVRITLPEANELTSAMFAPEDVLGVPRLVIKLHKNLLGERHTYPEFQGFLAGNSAAQNVQAANDHLGVVQACLSHVDWANHDSDNQLEFGFNWRTHRKPYPAEIFKTIQLFVSATD